MSTPEKQTVNPVGRSINEIVRDLSRPIPESLLKTRKQGGNTLTYVAWYDATRLLDLYAPGWQYHLEIKELAGKVLAIATITICAAEGMISRMATGFEEEAEDEDGQKKQVKYGDVFSNASSMALRRAAAHFGLARHLYNK